MKTTRSFQLIDGTFSPEEAGKVLGSMVKNKIDYHTLESHSDSELSGGSKLHSEERLQNLRELNANLRQLFNEASAGNKSLRISGTIEIDLVD